MCATAQPYGCSRAPPCSHKPPAADNTCIAIPSTVVSDGSHKGGSMTAGAVIRDQFPSQICVLNLAAPWWSLCGIDGLGASQHEGAVFNHLVVPCNVLVSSVGSLTMSLLPDPDKIVDVQLRIISAEATQKGGTDSFMNDYEWRHQCTGQSSWDWCEVQSDRVCLHKGVSDGRW